MERGLVRGLDLGTLSISVTNPMGVNSAISLGLCNSGSSAIEDQNMVPEGTKISQLMRCEICDIDFNSSIAYTEHISVKKHKKKSEMLYNMNITAGSAVAEAIKAAVAEGVEPKRQKLIDGSWKVIFMRFRFCSMCDVVCNTQEIYEQHLAGKKHAAQARKQAQNVKELSVAANPDSTPGVDPVVLPEDHNTSNPNKTCTGQFAWCEVCSISRTSEDILGIHKQGKKHLKNMKKAKMITSDALPGLMEELSRGIIYESKIANSDDSHAMIEDSEIKKRKMIEGSVEGSKVPDFVPEGNVEKSKLSDFVPEGSVEQSKLFDFIPEKIPTILPEDMKNGGTKGVHENKGTPKVASCDVCNINCTSEDLLVIHKFGRKHFKKLERLSTETSSSIPTPIDVPASMPETSPTNNLKIGNVTKFHGLEEDSEKKSAILEDNRKEEKVEKSAADLGFVCETSPTFCPLENKSKRHEIDPEKVNSDEFVSTNSDNKTDTIYGNSKDVVANHELGKKHLKNLEKLKINNPSDLHLQANQVKTDDLKNRNAINFQIPKTDSDMMKLEVTGIEEVGGAFRYEIEKPAAVNLNSVNGVNPTALPEENKNGMIRIEQSNINIDQEASENPDKKTSDQFAWCKVCNVYCNSEDVLTVHKSGKKHLKNMKKDGLLNVKANQESHDDMKTQTVIESQRPNKELEKTMKPEVPLIQDVGGSFRLCTVCNVFCNSQIVLDSHLAGQKHASLTRKLGTSSTGYQFAVAR